MIPEPKIPMVFRRCQALRESLNQVEREALRIQEIAINAAVAAAQTGPRAEVFGELSEQIATSGKRLHALATTARSEINGMSNLTLQALVIERMIAKYRAAAPHMKSESNLKLVTRIDAEMTNRNRVLMRRLARHAAPMRTVLRNLEQTHQRLFAVLSLVRIESLELEASHMTAVSALATSLQERTDVAAAQVAELGRILRDVTLQARLIASPNDQEDRREKIRAA